MPRRPAGAVRRATAPAQATDSLPAGWQQPQRTREGEFGVRTVPGSAARKDYRCPGCQQIIGAGVAHVVVWPQDDRLDGGVAARRHWHSACWQRRSTRGGPGRLPW